MGRGGNCSAADVGAGRRMDLLDWNRGAGDGDSGCCSKAGGFEGRPRILRSSESMEESLPASSVNCLL